MKLNKNVKLLKSFTRYCTKHPEERFWQALRNWSGYTHILKADRFSVQSNMFYGIKDTFYVDNIETISRTKDVNKGEFK